MTKERFPASLLTAVLCCFSVQESHPEQSEKGMTMTQRRLYSCSFCGKNQDQVQRLMTGPGAVYICNECIDSEAFEKDEQRGEQAKRCSFCGKTPQQTQYIKHGSGQAGICDECIALIRQIFREEEHTVRRRAAKPGEGEQLSLLQSPPEHDPYL